VWTSEIFDIREKKLHVPATSNCRSFGLFLIHGKSTPTTTLEQVKERKDDERGIGWLAVPLMIRFHALSCAS
jgi:hypothetical protein